MKRHLRIVCIGVLAAAAGFAVAFRPSAVAEDGRKPGGPPPLTVDKNAPLLLEEPGPQGKKTEEPSKGPVADNSPCYVCHDNLREEPFAQWHARKNVGCAKCHGDSTEHGADEAHTTPPDVMFAPEDIARNCATCHAKHNAPAAKVIARWQERCPNKTNPNAILCTDCHGDHQLKLRNYRWDMKTHKLIVGQKDR